jgi:uncharacterized membrane protein YkgB
MVTTHHARPASTALRLEAVGAAVTRHGRVLVPAWTGPLERAPYGTAAIKGLVANSPALSRTYRLASVCTAAPATGGRAGP